jgi:hypothetical protein
LPDGLTVGVISSTTQPFCRTAIARGSPPMACSCCACAQHGTDLRRPLRAGASRDADEHDPRGVGGPPTAAPKNLAVRGRSACIPLSVLKKDAHLEMHTREVNRS